MDTKNRFFSNADLCKLIVPLIIDQFLQAFVGLADSIMVASVGEAAVSGVSLIDTIMVLILNIFTALCININQAKSLKTRFFELVIFKEKADG